MSKIEVNQISSQCGSTLTIGQSGDTVTLACGASQTGFGRTGTVNWDTTAKTASFTAVSGNGYFVNTTSGAITVTLPASPSAGDIVSVSDYALTADTNNITIARNSSNIDGSAVDLLLNTKGVATTLVYVDATKGWKPVNSNELIGGPKFVTATGGTETTCGDYKIHTFTGPGTFTVSCAGNSDGSNTVDYLVVAGGGSGTSSDVGAGGGAGGYRESSGAASGCYTASPLGACVSALPISATTYPITVGAGGASQPVCGNISAPGAPGSNSIFSTITSAGGGTGGGGTPGAPNVGASGGSGGGGNHNGTSPGGAGNTPPVSPPQGNNGGPAGGGGPAYGSGGGGGAGQVGGTGSTPKGGDGGDGVSSSITGSSVARGGGGGGSHDCASPSANSSGGTGGGGGSQGSAGAGTSGTANTGGGGGGSSGPGGSPSGPGGASGAGGSGIVIIRYKYQ